MAVGTWGAVSQGCFDAATAFDVAGDGTGTMQDANERSNA